MQPDMSFRKNYEWLADYDDGNTQGYLVKRNFTSWKSKSWIVGIINEHSSKAYDWNELVAKRIIQDSLTGLPILITLEKDTASFHVFDRSLNGNILKFEKTNDENILKEINTQSTWNIEGVCIDGTFKGQQLQAVQASQEFWHSWSTFHPATTKYE